MLFYIVGLIHGQVWQSKKGGTWYMLQSFYPHAMDKMELKISMRLITLPTLLFRKPVSSRRLL